MSVTFGQNISALRSLRYLGQATQWIQDSSARLGSGSRINRGVDDAAGLAISSSLRANTRVFTQGIRNLNDGISALSIAEGALDGLSTIVTRQRELAVQASNQTLGSTQRLALDREAQTLAAEYRRVLEGTAFNGRQLLDGSTTSIRLQAGFGELGGIDVELLRATFGVTSVENGLGTYQNFNRSFGTQDFGNRGGPEFLVGDLNGDGIDDIIALRTSWTGSEFDWDIGFWSGEDGTSLFTLDDLESTAPFSLVDIIDNVDISAELVDLDDDGDLDLNVVLGVTMDGGASFSEVTFASLNASTVGGSINFSIPGAGYGIFNADETATSAVGDFNNDGVQDLLAQNGAGITIRIQDTETIETVTLDIESLTQAQFSLTSANAALSALDVLKQNLEQLTEKRGRLGSSESRVRTALEVLRSTTDNFTAVDARMTDADVSTETARLLQASILRESIASVLAQANLAPQIGLSLLQQAGS